MSKSKNLALMIILAAMITFTGTVSAQELCAQSYTLQKEAFELEAPCVLPMNKEISFEYDGGIFLKFKIIEVEKDFLGIFSINPSYLTINAEYKKDNTYTVSDLFIEKNGSTYKLDKTGEFSLAFDGWVILFSHSGIKITKISLNGYQSLPLLPAYKDQTTPESSTPVSSQPSQEKTPPTSTQPTAPQPSASTNLQIDKVGYSGNSYSCITTDPKPYRVQLGQPVQTSDITIPIINADTTKPIYVGVGTKSTIQPPTDKSISDFEADFGTGVNADSISWPEVFEDGLQFKLEPNAAIATITVKGWNQSTPFKIYACQDKDNDGKCGSNKNTQGYIEPDDELASLTIQASGTLKPVEETSCAPPQEEKKPAGECTTILECLAKIDQWIVQTLFK